MDIIAMSIEITQLKERIKQLEEAYKADALVAKDIIFDGARRNEEIRNIKSEADMHCGAISVLEDKVKQIQENMFSNTYKECLNEHDERISVIEEMSIEKKLLQLEKETNTHWKLLSDLMPKLDRKPHKCPVCDGAGGFLSSHPNQCIPCEGKGIVWG